MKHIIKSSLCFFLAAVMLLMLLPFGAFAGEGDTGTENDFSKHLSLIHIKDGEGKDLPAIVPKNASVQITFEYNLPEGNSFQVGIPYSFTLPDAVTQNYNEADIQILDKDENDQLAATVKVAKTGNCTITFTEYGINNTDSGTFNLGVSLAEKKIVNGATGLTFHIGPGGDTVKTINFAVDQITAGVTVQNKSEEELSNSRIKWTVTITPTLKNADALITGDRTISNFKITSQIHKDPKLSVVMPGNQDAPILTDKNGQEISGAHYELSDSGLTLTCSIDSFEWEAESEYTLVYYTTYDLATFQDKDSVNFSNISNASFEFPQYYTAGGASTLSLTGSNGSVSGKDSPSTASVAMKLLSKDFYPPRPLDIITWTIVVNESEVNFDKAYDLTDTIPDGLKLLTNTIKFVEDDKTATPIKPDEYTYTENNSGFVGYEGGTLVINKLAKDKKYTITYDTEIAPIIWQTEPQRAFNNIVTYSPEYNGQVIGDGTGKTGFTRPKIATGYFGGTGGGMLAASGEYNRTNHTFTWNILVNSMNKPLQSGVVTITIPKEQKYQEEIQFEGFSPCPTTVFSELDNKITVTFPTNVTAQGKITFKTQAIPVDDWATNKPNTAYTISANLKNSSINLTADPATDVITKVIEKSFSGYDFNKKQITWKINYNQNKMAMTNPIISDTLMEGLEYVEGSATNVTKASYNKSTRVLTLTLADAAISASPPSVTFITHITDETLLTKDGKEPSQKITNTASITFREAEGAKSEYLQSNECTKRVGALPLNKKGEQNGDYRNYTWTVGINPNQITMKTPSLTDNIPAGLILDLDSVRLYKADVDSSSGALTYEAENLVYSGEKPDLYPGYTAALDKQLFTFTFASDINTAYLLLFDTDNMKTSQVSYQNSIYFTAEEASPTTSGSISQAASSGSGTTNPKRGTIAIKATQDKIDGKPLPKVQYTITGEKTGFTYTVTTDSKGIALFEPLKFDTYIVTEALTDDSVKSYMPLAPTPIILLETREKIEATIPYKKDASEVHLTYHANANDLPNQTLKTPTYADGAKVAVLSNPFMRPNYVFDGWTTASDGTGQTYMPKEVLTLNKTIDLYAQWHKAAGKITLTAQSNEETPKLFENVALTLQGAEGTPSITQKTNAGGQAFFDVNLGTYTLSAYPSRLDGYLFNSLDKQAFKIEKDGDSLAGVLLYEPSLTLDYNGNGNTGGNAPETTYLPVNGKADVCKEIPFSKSGWSFVSWNTLPDGKGTAYAPGASFLIQENTTLYAIWQKNPEPDYNWPVKPKPDVPAPPAVDPNPFVPAGPAAPTEPDSQGPSAPSQAPNFSGSGWSELPTAAINKIPLPSLKKGTGGLVLRAVSTQGGAIQGVVFAIEGGDEKREEATDRNGYALFSDLIPGRYSVFVRYVPDGYDFNEEEIFDAEAPLGAWSGGEADLGRITSPPQTAGGFLVTRGSSVILMAIPFGCLGGFLSYKRRNRKKK